MSSKHGHKLTREKDEFHEDKLFKDLEAQPLSQQVLAVDPLRPLGRGLRSSSSLATEPGLNCN